jgi:hypothetical protein
MYIFFWDLVIEGPTNRFHLGWYHLEIVWWSLSQLQVNSYFRPLAKLISRKFFKILRPRITSSSWWDRNSQNLHTQRIRPILVGGNEVQKSPSQTTNYGTRLQKLASRDEHDRIRAFQIIWLLKSDNFDRNCLNNTTKCSFLERQIVIDRQAGWVFYSSPPSSVASGGPLTCIEGTSKRRKRNGWYCKDDRNNVNFPGPV